LQNLGSGTADCGMGTYADATVAEKEGWEEFDGGAFLKHVEGVLRNIHKLPIHFLQYIYALRFHIAIIFHIAVSISFLYSP